MVAYKKKYDNMSIVELLTVCEAEGISYREGGEILNADQIRVKLGKKEEKEEKEVEKTE